MAAWRASRAVQTDVIARLIRGSILQPCQKSSRVISTAISTEAISHEKSANGSHTSEEFIQWEDTFSAHNYHPVPVVFSKAKDAEVWDPEGRKYLDFLATYSAVNQVKLIYFNLRSLH